MMSARPFSHRRTSLHSQRKRTGFCSRKRIFSKVQSSRIKGDFYTPCEQVTITPNPHIADPLPADFNPIQWSSEVYDFELGLTYYNYRHYNPIDGRWISRDRIEENGGHNLYCYINNSFNNTDILGMASIPPSIVKGIVGKVIKTMLQSPLDSLGLTDNCSPAGSHKDSEIEVKCSRRCRPHSCPFAIIFCHDNNGKGIARAQYTCTKNEYGFLRFTLVNLINPPKCDAKPCKDFCDDNGVKWEYPGM